MSKDWKYILYISVAIALFVAVRLSSTPPFDWTPTLAHDDKNPFGAYVLHELAGETFAPHSVSVASRTLYEISDSLKRGGNIFVLSMAIAGDEEDTRLLLEHVAKGATAFLSAQYFSGKLADTLKLKTNETYFEGLQMTDTTYLRFVRDSEDFYYRTNNIPREFTSIDTARSSIVAVNQYDKPVLIRTRWGKGSFILNCTPLAFSNIYMLQGRDHNFVARALGTLPQAPLIWAEYYSMGRREAQSPLRFILRTPPLAWAYYLTIISLLLFMIFEAKRRQRAIPVIEPPKNTTLQFIGTISNLYFASANHRSMAEKKILFFLELLRSRHGVSGSVDDPRYVHAVARRLGKSEDELKSLFEMILRIRASEKIPAAALMELNASIESLNLER